jgi:SagB-type dehydrogenase family enzyme
MRFKRSAAIVITLENDDFVFHSTLSYQTCTANPTALEIVRRLGDWSDLEGIMAFFPGYSRASVDRSVQQLIELGALIVEGSDAAERDRDFEDLWLWGPLAAAYHFGARDTAFVSVEASHEALREQVKFIPSPRLYLLNEDRETDVLLSLQEKYREPFLTMARRRTNRVLLDQAITLQQLADCLLFSMAITGIIAEPEVVDLPVKMTPSGGGRNPYEAYVCVRNVEGVPPGVYHFSAMQRTLGIVDAEPPPPFPDMLAGQPWTANAAAVIFLVANFDRAMWKYHNAGAYRVVMLEAGHIAQNISLAATAHGLAANPTGAMSHDLVERTLHVGGITQSVVYALVMGAVEPVADEALWPKSA